MKRIKAGPGMFATVDDEDYEWLSQWRWGRTYYKNKYTQYSHRMLPRQNGKYAGSVYMHRLILGAKAGEVVDHADGNGMNNQRSNLRLCSQGENNLNGRKRKGCSSQYRGVTWRKDTKKWQAQAWWHKKRYSLGCHDTEEEAAQAYNEFVHGQPEHQEFVRENNIPTKELE